MELALWSPGDANHWPQVLQLLKPTGKAATATATATKSLCTANAHAAMKIQHSQKEINFFKILIFKKNGQRTWIDISPKIQMADKHMTKSWLLLIMREEKSKLQWGIASYPSGRLLQGEKSVGKNVEKLKPFVHYWWQCKMEWPPCKGGSSKIKN